MTVNQQANQMELFGNEAAKAIQSRAKTGGNRKPPRGPGKHLSPNTRSSKGLLTTKEQVVHRLDEAMIHVVSKKGSHGIDRMSVRFVKANWSSIKPRLLESLESRSFRPSDLRRVYIPKPGGGKRPLSIPTVLDRIIQQAIHLVIAHLFEKGFHQNSHGFRPGRGCHSAIEQARGYIAEGCGWVVDIDLESFFTTVNHQRLMSRLREKIKDGWILGMIYHMVRAKVVLPDGVKVNTDQGLPQGGPLSPLLSNIVLDELDWELQKRGHRFVRYADDCNVYVKSKKAGERVMASLRKFIERKLRLQVNDSKSSVAEVGEPHFLGFRLGANTKDIGGTTINLSKRSKKRLRAKSVELTPRNYGQSMESCIETINTYLKGWYGYFKLCTGEESFREIAKVDAHIRRRLRAIRLRQWKRNRTRARKLRSLGVSSKAVAKSVYRNGGLWKLSTSYASNRGMNNAYWANAGLVSLVSLWKEQAMGRVVGHQQQLQLL